MTSEKSSRVFQSTVRRSVERWFQNSKEGTSQTQYHPEPHYVQPGFLDFSKVGFQPLISDGFQFSAMFHQGGIGGRL